MGSVRLALRADLRLRWRALLGLALLLGLIGGVVLTAAAGARRTDTAYPRLLRWSNAAQVLVIPEGTGQGRFYAALRRLPAVASMSTAGLYNMMIPVRHGLPYSAVETSSSFDGTLGVSADRVKIIQGRLFGRRAAGEAVIDQQLADREHLRPGGTLHLLGVPNDPATGVPDLQRAVPLAFRVSAIAVFNTQVVPATKTNAEPMALLSPPFSGTRTAGSFSYGDYAGVRLQPGASTAAFMKAASALARGYPATGRKLLFINLSDEVAATQRAITPEAVALALFAALAGVIALAVIAQLLGRQLLLDSTEFPILRVLGMTRSRLVALSLTRLAEVTVAGGVIAVGVAIAASPLMPIGPARLAEPSPGIEINLAVLAAGFALLALLPLAAVTPTAWRAASQAQGPLGVAEPISPARASRLGPALGLAGSVTGGIGVRMALEPGHGRTAVPVRSTLVGTIVAVTSVVAALIFGASLVGLVSTPHRYGQNWVQEVDLGFGSASARQGARFLMADPAIAGYAAGDYGQVSVNGRIVAAIGIDALRGQGFVTLLAGRAASTPDEVVLGAQTLRTLHRRLGQSVRVVVNQVQESPGSAGVQRTMRIVGVAVFPAFGRGSFTATDLGNGAVFAASVLSEPDPQTGCVGRATCYNFFLLRYQPGADLAAASARLNTALIKAGCPPGSCQLTTDQRPSTIRNYTSVRDTPLALGAVLALLAIGTLTHVLLSGVRRRRRDLAVLKTLGLVRSQLLRVVSWQASTLTVVALAVGLPLGVLAGRWSWALFAGATGVAGRADIPVPLVLAAIPVTLVLAIAIAAGPGWTAARLRPALILRSE
jgi:ABC-type antimicrobial peptide transport system permease subunit